MGGAPAAAAIIGGGLVVGILVGGVTGAGQGGGGASPSIVVSEIVPCPGSGPKLLDVSSGQHVLITGKTADGVYIRVHLPGAVRDEGWALAAAYTVQQGSLDDVPVVDCAPAQMLAFAPSPSESQTETGSFEPTAVPTAVPSASPSPSPTPTAAPTPTPRPGATPRPPTPKPPTPPPTKPPTPPPPPGDTTPPKIVRFSAGLVGCQSIAATAFVEDPESGVVGVNLRWTDPTGKADSLPMQEGDPNFWHGSITSPTGGLLMDGTWKVFARARNGDGLRSDSNTVNVVVNC